MPSAPECAPMRARRPWIFRLATWLSNQQRPPTKRQRMSGSRTPAARASPEATTTVARTPAAAAARRVRVLGTHPDRPRPRT